MAELLAKILYRVALPLTLLAACLFRYNAISGIYLLCLLFIPLISSPSRSCSSRAAIIIQAITLALSSLFIFAHITFQIVLVSYGPYGHFIKSCTNSGDLAAYIGFHRFDQCNVIDIIRLLAPDVIVFTISLITLITSRHVHTSIPPNPDTYDPINHVEQIPTVNATSQIEEVLPIFVALMLLIGGIMQPNILSSVYFLTFLVLGVCWAFHLSTHLRNNKVYCLKIILTVYAALHVIMLYLYQMVFMQQMIKPDELVPRLLGLPAIVNSTDCHKRAELHLHFNLPWPFLVYPLTIFVLYWLLAVENRLRCKHSFSDSVVEKMNWWHPRAWSKNSNQPLLTNAPTNNQQYGSVQPPTEEPVIREEIEEPVHIQGTLSSIMMFMMRQSYIAALIIMMTWSITYHSWLTFVLLLWACLTWITPFARWFCMVSSPYLVIYADLLLIVQYIYGMNLAEDELPTRTGQFKFSELGLNHTIYPVLHLGAQTLFTWVFLITLRQHIREKKMKARKGTGTTNAVAGEMVLTTIARPLVQAFRKRVTSTKSVRKDEHHIDEVDQGVTPSDDAKELMLLLKSVLSKYWILICCAAFLLVALQNQISLYQIFYMVIFLMGFVVYQFSLRIWKLILRPLWWFMVVYSIIILLTIYTYQFDNMHEHWSNGTHLSDQWLFDLGLRQQSKTHLLLELLIPTIFSIVIVVQLHFFHKPLMMKINRILRCRKNNQKRNRTMATSSSTSRASSRVGDSSSANTMSATTLSTTDQQSISEEEVEDQTILSTMERIIQLYKTSTVILWRFAEIHISKIICFIVMLVVVQQVSAVNGILIIFVALAMPSEYIQKLLNYIMITWSSIVVLVYMFYQLQFVKEDMLNTNCSSTTNITFSSNNSHFNSNAWWLGFHKSDSVSRDVRGYLFIIMAIVFQKVVKHHQELYRYRKGITTIPPQGVLFPNISRAMADENIENSLKYMSNNFFKLFGLEINIMVMVLCMSIRADAVAVLHSLWVAIFLLIRRKNTGRIWSMYMVYLSISLPVQYLLILGWPPGLCKGYPWDDWQPSQLIHWLFLTSVEKPQNQYILLVDYFQFLVACCQANAFVNESIQKKLAQDINTSSVYDDDHYIPPDFMGNKTWLDFVKIVILDQFLWLTLTVVYVTAQNTTSLFNSGFIVGCFFFLWHGQSLYLRPRLQMRRWWKTLIAYNFFVIIAKVWLQLVSCVYIQTILKSTDCYLIQLLNLYCLRGDVYDEPYLKFNCETRPDTGLLLDGICFIVVMIQYRIFKSTYFKYVIREHRRQSEMAFRGAQLVEERLQVRSVQSIQRDQKKMKLIKDKVARLKKRLAERNPYAEEPLSHYEAIYGGDYYLFEESESDSDGDIKEDEQTEDSTINDSPKKVCGECSHEVDGTNEMDQTDILLPPTPDDVTDEATIETTLDTSTDGLRQRKRKTSKLSLNDIEILSSPMMNNESVEESVSYTVPAVPTEDENPPTETFKQKVKNCIHSSNMFFHQLANVGIKFFNECSSDYRYIASQLNVELRERAKTIQENHRIQQSHHSTGSHKGSEDDLHSSSSSNKDDDSDTWSIVNYDEQESWKQKKSYSVRLAVSFYYALLANTDLLCYSLMIINHMYYASALSMPLPFFVFLWGMLSIPRPTKRFWIAIITYVQLTIVVKYIFQFQFPEDRKFNFNECSYYDSKEAKSPLCPPRIIGIERNRYSSTCDLILLLGLFFHRFALKKHGLWREKSWSEDEEDMTPRTSQQSGTPYNHSIVEETANMTHNNTTNTSLDATHNRTSYLDSNRPNSRASSAHHKRSLFYNIKRFIHRMLDPEVGTGAVDVYAWMFGSQFIVFIIILSSWSAFSSNEGTNSNFAKIIEENVVPKTFLYMLLTQFLLIVFDRYLYMRKHVFFKMLYLVFLAFVFHIFLFIIVPEITQRPFTQNIPAIFMYLFQCIYFALSAYQVRCGYPTRILGNFLTKNYTVTSGILFQGIQAIPFLLELRSVLDWVCTKTTLTLNHWLKVEDIYANVFIMKCWRDSEKTWPHPRGMAYWTSSKWLIGGLLVVLLIVVIWFPLLFMSFINSAYISNKPVEVTFTLTVGGYQPLFRVTTQQQFIKELDSEEIANMIRFYHHADNPYWNQLKVDQMMDEYKKKGNIMRIKVLSNSSAIWTISPPSREYLIQNLANSNASISLRFKYEFSREPNATTIVQETVSGITTKILKHGDEIRTRLAQVLNSTTDGSIRIPNLFPTYIQVPASGAVKPVEWLGRGSYVNATIVLRRGSAPQMNSTQVEWWEIIQDEPQPIFTHAGPGYLEIIALNDLVPPLHLSFFASKGIIGLYVGFVWLVGKFVRLFFTSISYRIMFDEMPNVDRILKLCLEIYMVRESKELRLEEDLIAKLMFLYRSPETLIKWTKYKRLKRP